jgi:cytochrome c553
MNRSRFSLLVICTSLLGYVVNTAVAQPLKPVATSGCEACHGVNGNSQKPDVPRLNGQQSAYMLARLREFQDPTRGTPHSRQMMGPNASSIDDVDAAALADYFSRQTPTPLSSSGPMAEAGRKIFIEGTGPLIPGPLIPPCGTCHGQNGQGQGEVPRIAGQHRYYLSDQLQDFMRGTRVGTPMNNHAWAMTTTQIQALTAYLSNN